tara:strand:+ start:4908 stop:5498 length:591 start_codon:yes stop_codon:yes gene_type:complete
MIKLNSLPNNVLNLYFNGLKPNDLITNYNPDVEIYIHRSAKQGSAFTKIIWKSDNFFYKIFNFYDTQHPHFMPSVCYDKIFPCAIKKNFFDNITLVDSFIYDDINKRVIGYKYPILNTITKMDKNKYNDLLKRIIIQTRKTNIVYADLVPQNVMEFENKYYIIDLETVTSIEIYKNHNIRNKYFITNCKTYERNII